MGGGVVMHVLESLDAAKNYSQKQIERIRSRLKDEIDNNSVCIATVGSFARREASEQSDIDFFVIVEGSMDAEQAASLFRRIVTELDIRMPATTGAFNEIETRQGMTKNIGGADDNTEKLTRRLLFLLEGEWLYNENLFNDLFDEFLNRYVKDSITQHQLCRFLLNDLIRYYRTIGVDFEYKTEEAGKPWGDRNIKLMFSRKLLYFSGILVVAETVQNDALTKRAILKKYLRMTPIQRVQEICGSRAEKALLMYDEFSRQMALPGIREILKRTRPGPNNEQPAEFRCLKNKAHHFSWELSRLLSDTYDSSHPIHLAIKF
jgi:predicted nucleotidyltransferase